MGGLRVAIVHDFLNQRGGAERVVAVFAKMFPNAPIFTSIYDPEKTFDEFKNHDVRTTFLQKMPHGDAAFRALLPLYPSAFKSIDLSGYDLVVSSSTHWGHRVDPKGAHHVVYCHNPPRWLYQTDEYLSEGTVVPGWLRPLISPALRSLKKGDLKAAAGPDKYICNSRVVAGRIRQLYGREAEVIPPPIETDRLLPAFERKVANPAGDHYLVVSRLLPYKRVDLAVSVCTERGVPLVVVGEGPAKEDLQKIAGPNVRFTGRVRDEEFIDLFARAKALIHCAYEDFGIVLLEANAAGIPCVAFGNGGALETVIPGETGILFPVQMGGALMEGLEQFESKTWNPHVLRTHARKFDEQAFISSFLRAIQFALGGSSE